MKFYNSLVKEYIKGTVLSDLIPKIFGEYTVAPIDKDVKILGHWSLDKPLVGLPEEYKFLLRETKGDEQSFQPSSRRGTVARLISIIENGSGSVKDW